MGCCSSSPGEGSQQPVGIEQPPQNQSSSTPGNKNNKDKDNMSHIPSTKSSATKPLPENLGSPAPASEAPPPSKVHQYAEKSYLDGNRAPQPGHVSMETMKKQPPGPKTNPSYRGWAPPAKEWDKQTEKKGDKTRFEIEEKWDEDGNLHRTTVKKTITPDWKTKTERTTEIIPAKEAAKFKGK